MPDIMRLTDEVLIKRQVNLVKDQVDKDGKNVVIARLIEDKPEPKVKAVTITWLDTKGRVD